MSRELSRMSRREVCAVLAVACAGLAGGGCLPLSRLTSRTRARLAADPAAEERVLRAFVDAVVPGLPDDRLLAADLTRPFTDPELPFHPYHLDLAADLCGRAARLDAGGDFSDLAGAARREIIQGGLDGGWLTVRLYVAAVFIAQVSAYANIYSDEGGCSLIGFAAAAQPLDWAQMSHPDMPGLFLAAGDDGGQPE